MSRPAQVPWDCGEGGPRRPEAGGSAALSETVWGRLVCQEGPRPTEIRAAERQSCPRVAGRAERLTRGDEEKLRGSYWGDNDELQVCGYRSQAPAEGPDRRDRSVVSILAFLVRAFFVSCKQLVSCISWVKDSKKEKLPLSIFDSKRKERPTKMLQRVQKMLIPWQKAGYQPRHPQDKSFLQQIAAFFFYTMMESTSACGAPAQKETYYWARHKPQTYKSFWKFVQRDGGRWNFASFASFVSKWTYEHHITTWL